MKIFDFSTYNSPLTWRYGTKEMRFIFSEQHKYELWRKIWVALAEAQHEAGLVSDKELLDLKKHESNISIERILEIEQETSHDVVAAIREFAEKARIGGGKLHLGATSMDIVDNADIVRTHEALKIIEAKLISILHLFAEKIETYASTPCIGFTHLQPAEPTTVGYRLAFYAQDLLTDYELLQFVKETIKGKGIKGAVGTAASYKKILDETDMTVDTMENMVMQKLGIDPVTISTQVYPRKFDYLVLTLLASISSSLAKFAGDLRVLQSPPIGEWSEPFGKNQVGSSAMPFKKNPLNSEKICSLARLVNQLPSVALENASLSYLERTLDDSANKRIIISEGFLLTDEIIKTAEKIVEGLVINSEKIKYNLDQYAPFSATETIIIECVKKGADRQKMHELLREISMIAWGEIQKGQNNPMKKLLTENIDLKKHLDKETLEKLLDVSTHTGTADQRSLLIVKQINKLDSS
jgi:adenylosuccinate lyase